MLNPDPTVSIKSRVTERDVFELQNVIRQVTGLVYRYIATDGVDFQVSDFETFDLHLCGRRHDGRTVFAWGLSKNDREIVDRVIRAWAISTGRMMPIITWCVVPVKKRSLPRRDAL